MLLLVMFLGFGLRFYLVMARVLIPCVQMGCRVIVWWLLQWPETSLRSRFLTGVISLPFFFLIIWMVRWIMEGVTGVLSVVIRILKILFSFVWITLPPGPFRLLILELVLWRIIQRFLMIFWLRVPLRLVASRVFSRLIKARVECIIVMIRFLLVKPILTIPLGVLFLPRLTLILLIFLRRLSLSLINHFE